MQSVLKEDTKNDPISTINSSYTANSNINILEDNIGVSAKTALVMDKIHQPVSVYKMLKNSAIEMESINDRSASPEIVNSLLNHAHNIFWVVDENSRLMYCSKSMLDLFNADETIMKQDFNIAFPRTLTEATLRYHNMVISDNADFNYKVNVQLPGGINRILEVNTFPVCASADGKLVGNEAQDITETFQLKQQLDTAKEQLFDLNQATPEAIWGWNLLAGKVFRNNALLEMTGDLPDEALDLIWWLDRIHEADRKRVKNKIKTVLANKLETWQEAYQFKCNNGKYIAVIDHGYVIYEEDKPVRMIGSLHDVSELKEIETRLEAIRVIEQKEELAGSDKVTNDDIREKGQELNDNLGQLIIDARSYLEKLNPGEEKDKKNYKKGLKLLGEAIHEIQQLMGKPISPELDERPFVDRIQELIDSLLYTGKVNIDFVHKRCQCLQLSIAKRNVLCQILRDQLKNMLNYSKANNIHIGLHCINKHILLQISDDGIGYAAMQKKGGKSVDGIYDKLSVWQGSYSLVSTPDHGFTLTIKLPIE